MSHCRLIYSGGKITLSITWMTPLLLSTSVATMFDTRLRPSVIATPAVVV